MLDSKEGNFGPILTLQHTLYVSVFVYVSTYVFI